ncbi:hypothetical protein [Pedobacter sp. ASV28]|uniref:hypothetical protein n=1 Tax=Pedobacter sp. ASV28 TaxID=2795123 RepID=UPI0018EC52BA|nr:hypothetical protein [Pedobacter sp. ASV28]
MKKFLLMLLIVCLGVTTTFADPCLTEYNVQIVKADSDYSSAMDSCIQAIAISWLSADATSMFNINCAMDAYWGWYTAYDNAAYFLAACAGVPERFN